MLVTTLIAFGFDILRTATLFHSSLATYAKFPETSIHHAQSKLVASLRLAVIDGAAGLLILTVVTLSLS